MTRGYISASPAFHITSATIVLVAIRVSVAYCKSQLELGGIKLIHAAKTLLGITEGTMSTGGRITFIGIVSVVSLFCSFALFCTRSNIY